jgi:hypothetical protein
MNIINFHRVNMDTEVNITGSKPWDAMRSEYDMYTAQQSHESPNPWMKFIKHSSYPIGLYLYATALNTDEFTVQKEEIVGVSDTISTLDSSFDEDWDLASLKDTESPSTDIEEFNESSTIELQEPGLSSEKF